MNRNLLLIFLTGCTTNGKFNKKGGFKHDTPLIKDDIRITGKETVDKTVEMGPQPIEGDVIKLSPEEKHKLPNISWSEISYSSKSEPLLEGINQSDRFYHIHSFYAEPKSGEHILAKTKFFDKSYCSIAKKGNIFGCQFHPEKSGEQGLKIIKNFVDISNTNE